MEKHSLYTSEDHKNWFYEKYFYQGGNSRYYTFQLALNLLFQYHSKPTIIETGCQRQKEDVGAGMSTSIFAEYIARNGGSLITIDLDSVHLDRARQYVSKWKDIDANFISSDSVLFLKQYSGKCDLLYLDSLDYPIAENEGDVAMQLAAQTHCLNEFRAIENRLSSNTLLLIDDNQLPGGGKPQILKTYLTAAGWKCLLDLQSTLWIQEL